MKTLLAVFTLFLLVGCSAFAERDVVLWNGKNDDGSINPDGSLKWGDWTVGGTWKTAEGPDGLAACQRIIKVLYAETIRLKIERLFLCLPAGTDPRLAAEWKPRGAK